MIEKQLGILHATRKNILAIASSYTNEQLNFIPENFNNNLIWNMGHLLVTQQLLTYGRCDIPAKVSKELIEKYKKGTKPVDKVQSAEVDFIKERLVSILSQTKEDYDAGTFKNFKSYQTSYGITLDDIDDAINFNNVHEALHFGTILSLRKMVY